jgi:hypothetical protein
MRRGLALALVVIAHSARAQSLPTFVTSPVVTIDSIGDTTRMSNRFTDAKRLSDGRVVAAVCPASELRNYDATGKRLGALTLPQPPGQRSLTRLFMAGGDTVAAYESLNPQLTMIEPAFKVLRTLMLPNPDTATFNGMRRPTRLDVIGRLSDGTFIGRIVAPPSRDSGYQRRSLTLYRFEMGGKLLDSLTVPANEDRVIPGARVPQAIRMGRTTGVAIVGDRIVVADQTKPHIEELTPDLKFARRTPTLTKPAVLSDSVRDAWTRVAVTRTMTPANGVLAVYGDFYPESTPAFRDVLAGSDRSVWVQDPAGADFYPLIWTSYQGGQAVARAELPPRFYPTQFGKDWVLGLAFDTTATDKLQLLQLVPGPLTNKHLPPKDAAPANRPRCGAWTSR